MLPFVGSLLAMVRLGPSGQEEDCLLCGRAIRRADERMDIPGGGVIHRGCATYRMRRHARAVRRIGSP